MSRNLKINNYMKNNKKNLVVPENPIIFKLNIQEIISEISNFVKQEENLPEEKEEK